MPLIHIPQIQFYETQDKTDWKIAEINIKKVFEEGYEGLFTTISIQESNFIFAIDDKKGYGVGHLHTLQGFIEIAENKYGFENLEAKATGGGSIYIVNNRQSKLIKFYKKSGLYGKYEKSIIEPIAEKLKSENLPDAQLIFE
ncbi:MAG: hypothetical protein RL557_76 [archaeon]